MATNPHAPDFEAYARDYAAAGWPVFPLVPRTKRPATAHGKDDATTDPDQIRRWWADTPTANIGMRLPDGVLALDVDPRHGGSLDQLGDLPATWTARTGGGGWHLLFRYQGPVVGRVRDTAGIDIKTHTGYIVVAPSIHPGGGTYTWTNAVPPAPLPAHLHARVRREPDRPRAGRGRAAPGGLVAAVANATEGNRNNALYWAACRAAAEDAPAHVWGDLRASAHLVGLDDWEIDRTLASALQRKVVDQ